MSVRITIVALLVLIGCIMVVSSSTAEEWIVDDDWVGADFDNIQDALNGSSESDIIYINSGLYPENIVINTSISILGNQSTTEISGDGNFHVIQINADNVTLGSLSVYNSGYPYAGIHVESNFVNIFNCSMNNNFYGIKIYHSNNNTVSNNLCVSEATGIHVGWSNDNLVENNTCYSNVSNGIYIAFSDGNIVRGNLCDFCEQSGISVNGESSYNLVESNICRGNDQTGQGIYIGYASDNNSFVDNLLRDNSHGIRISHSIWNLVENNTITNNDYGIYFIFSTTSSHPECTGSPNNEIRYNEIQSNSETGIYIENDIIEVVIHNNNIRDNSDQAVDNGNNNTWYMNFRGNYWDDYSGSDNDEDGIGDSAYDINGQSTSRDSFPLMAPVNISSNRSTVIGNITVPLIVDIRQPSNNITFDEGDLVEFVGESWSPVTIIQWIWNSSLDGKLYGGINISFQSRTLSNGTHIITLVANDELGNWSEESTLVININGIPRIKKFTFSSTPAVSGECVLVAPRLRDDGLIVHYNWSVELPDGNTTHQYNTAVLDFNYSVVGWYRIMLSVIDEHEVSSDESETSLYVNMIPGVFITSLQRYQKLNGTVSIIGYAVDENPTTLEFVEIAIDDGNWIKVSGVENWIYQWNTTIWDGTSLEDGSHLVKARSFDGMHYSDIAYVYIILDNIPDDGSSDGGGDDGIPGFGLPVFMLGLIILVGLMRKRGH